MAQGYDFPPINIKAAFYDDGSARSSFLTAIGRMTTDAETRFRESFGNVRQIIDRSIASSPPKIGFQIDLSSLRQAAAEAQHAAQSIDAMRVAAINLSRATGDTSTETRLYIKALSDESVAADYAARAAQAQVTTYQRLQGEISKTVRANQQLSQSYRDTFLEQARAENFAYRSQQAVNTGFAPGLTRKATDNGAGYSALAGLLKEQEAADAAAQAIARQAQEYDRLRVAEEAAARGARVIAEAYRGTALEIGYTTKSARESAAAFQAAFAAQEKAAADAELAAKRAAMAQAELAQAANELRRQLDPSLVIQQKFDAELANADRLLKQGAISQREYAQAVTLARQNMQESWSVMTRGQEAITATSKRGTEANHMMVNSVRAQRTAFIQLGQQMQDVVIQAQMGTKGLTIFTQQVPQMAFALSGLTESSNRFLQKIGTVGTVLSGPLGAGLIAATALMGPFIAGLFQSGDAADAASKSNETLAQKLDLARHSFEEVTKAAAEYNAEQVKARETSLAAAEAVATKATQDLKEALAIREKLQAQLELNQANAAANAGQGTAGAAGAYTGGAASVAQARLSENLAAIKTLTEAARNATIGVADELGKINSDPTAKLRAGFEKLRNDAKASIKDVNALATRLADLNRQEKAATEAISKSKSTSSGLFGREIGLSEAKSIASGAGLRVTSALRTKAEQQWLYDNRRTPTNPVALPGTSAHEKGNALDIAFGKGISAASIKKAYADAGVKLTKILKEDGHFHIEWSTKGADKVEREIDQLAQFGDRAKESIARINAQFDEQPRLIDQAAAATRELDKLIAEVSEKKPVDWQQMVADAQAAKGVIQEALVRPFEQLMQESERRLEIERLITAGKFDEAQATQLIWQYEERNGQMKEHQKRILLEQVRYERQITEELRARQEVMGYFLDASRSIKQEIASIFSGNGSFKNITQVFKNLSGQVLTEQLFGGMFRDLDNWLKGQSGLGSSVDYLSEESVKAGDAMKDLADAAASATQTIAGSSGTNDPLMSAFDAEFGLAANDNAGKKPITVFAPKADRKSLVDLSPAEYFQKLGQSIGGRFTDALNASFNTKFFSKFSGAVGGAFEGYATTGTGFGAVLGGLKELKGLPEGLSKGLGKAFSGAQTGAMVAGIGNAMGIKMSNTGAQIGGAVGKFIPIPGGEIIGSIAGGLIGKLFKSVKSGYAQVRNGSVVGTYGRTGSLQNDAAEAAGGLVDTIASLAKTLDTKLGAYDFDFGKKDNQYVVNTGSRGVFNFANEKDAMEFAVREAVADGAFIGLMDAQKRLLMKGGDLQTQAEKAVSFGSVFKQLRAMKDPAGAALDDLNKQFEDLKSVFAEAGASAEEYAKLEELYGLKRVEIIKQVSEQMNASLQSLLNDLTVNNDTLSLRDRKAMALDKYSPLAARVAAGDTSAYNDFAEAARTLLAIEREISGSTASFFDRQAEVTSLTKKALDGNQMLIDAASSSSNPFSGNAAAAANDNQGVIDAIDRLGGQLDAVNQNLGALIAAASGGGSSFQSVFDTNYAMYF